MSRRGALPDQPARDVIEQGLDLNLLVEAGAGSGKTESLARRMAAGIVEGHYRVEDMAAVTFTRKAAAELRGRFQIVLEQKLREERDETRKARIHDALSHLERLFAGTIHAFCAHLLRERPVEAGVAPCFSELDETADAEVRREAWRDYLDRERASASPILHELREAGIAPSSLDRAFQTVCLYPEVEFPPGTALPPDPAPARQALDGFWQRLMRLLPDPIPPETTCRVQQAARELHGRLRVADRSRPEALAELLAPWEGDLKIVQKWWGETSRERREAKNEVEALVRDFRESTVQPFLAAWRQYAYRLVVTLLVGGRAVAAEARRGAVTLNYGDLLQVAARLLRENLEVRAALQRKYRWLFVDEFQDTDPIQAEVILLLAAEPGAGGDWTQVPLRPGALFIVGDPKQSIYRFRRADIDTYTRVEACIQTTGGQVVELTASFRAVPALCRWANTVFPNLFPQAPTPEQPAFHGLDPVREEADPKLTGVRALTIPDTVTQGQVAAADAVAIAGFIRAEVDRGQRSWGDFLILTRKRKQLPVYARALDERHIPVEVSGGAAFAASPKVVLLAGLLRALSDPDDGPALVGVLRGLLFGLSDEALFQHRQAGYGLSLAAPLPDQAEGPVVEALRALQELYHWTRTLPFPAAVERILEVTGLLALGAAETPGGAEAADLLHAVDRVRQITERGGSLAEAAQALEEDLESSEVESLPLEPGRRDAVRLMNLHQVKGLEAPVVFLADPLGGVKERASIRIVRDQAQAVGYFQVTRRVGEWGQELVAEPAGWESHADAELAYVRAEEQRLLYVAATRAAELLVISRWAKAGGGSVRPWEPFDPYLDQAQALRLPTAVILPREQPADFAPDARAAAEATRAERRQVALEPSWEVESVTATSHRSGGGGRRATQEGRAREPDTGMGWGRLVHALLEHAVRGPHRDRAHLERLAQWLTLNNPELRRVLPQALDAAERVMASGFWERAMGAEERHVEVPFAVRVDAEASPPRILHGIIDLALRFPTGWELIDYKTDELDMEALVEQYGDQVRQYARHWAELTGTSVSYAGLYAVRGGELTENLVGL
ncbi:MAG: UvrD-helicase domain-containing protein [Candidatus Methylomirabilia bacterium]